MTTAPSDLLEAAAAVVEAVTYDDSGENGMGGNGGLLSRETLHKVDNLRKAMERQRSFQERVAPWLLTCFGPEIAGDREERNHRFLEESLELVQAWGCTADEAHQLVDYVFGREPGDPHQEVGGVMVCLAAACLANNLDMDQAAEDELNRVWTMVEKIRAKHAAKPKFSPLPGDTR